ncbi:MAG: glycosyltransferase family 4 protein [Micromonosporaceae bacterium]
MKILLSSFQCLPDRGSELGNGWHWARALADCGHDVTVLTQPSDIIRAAAPPDIKFLHVDASEPPQHRFSSVFVTTKYYLRWQDAALRYVETQMQQQYDVVHHVTWGSLRLGSRLWRLPVPLVYGPIGGGQTAPSSYWRYFGRAWSVEMVRKASAGPLLKLNGRSRETMRNSAVTLVTNSATAAACQRLGAADVRYMLADGLPRDWLGGARSRPAGTPVVLWVGSLLPHKAPTLSLQAFAELRRAMPARLLVAGDGPLFGQVRTMVERLGLTEDVQLLGRVPWKDMKSLYDSASVFLFNSLRDSSSSQFLEALGRGLPTVALDHHGIGDADVGPAALKVALPERPRDLPGRLASALQTILSDHEWESRSAAGVNWAAGHVWPAKAAAATQIYQEIVRSSPGTQGGKLAGSVG